MTSSSTSRTPTPPIAWLLLALSGAIAAVWFVHALGYWEDDAYIHLEFARSVAAGHGFAFNGRIVYGDTSPLWVYLLIGFHALIPDWMAAGKTLTAVAAVFSLTGAYFFSRGLVRGGLSEAGSSVFAATMVLVFVLSPYFGYWAFSGMEALAAAGVVCWGLVAVAPRQLSPGRFLVACFLAGLAPVLRPEMSFFTVLLGLVLLQRLYVAEGTLKARRGMLVPAGFVLMAAPAVLWARYALHAFGMVVPNTNAAKRASPGDSVVRHLVQVYCFGFPVVVVGLLLLGAWAVWYLAGRRDVRARRPGIGSLLHAGGWLLFVWTAINCVFYVADHTYVQTRYIFVTAPVLTMAILAIAELRFPRVYRGLLGFALCFGVVLSALATWPLISAKKQVDLYYAQLADYVRQFPPEAGVADYSIGEVAFLSGHTIVDTGGITRPSLIPLMADPTEERRNAWMYAQGAQYEVIDHQPMPGAVLVWSQKIPSTGWTLHLGPSHTFEMLMLWKLPPQPQP
jgi:hypothetical protein